MTAKHRLSVTVDDDVVEAGRAAVAAGRSESLSAWVNDALRAHTDHERRLAAMDEFLLAFEAEHGTITDEEIEEARRSARARAVIVRPGSAPARERRAG